MKVTIEEIEVLLECDDCGQDVTTASFVTSWGQTIKILVPAIICDDCARSLKKEETKDRLNDMDYLNIDLEGE